MTLKPRGALESFLGVAAISGLAFGAMWKVFTGEPAETSTLMGLAFGVAVAAFSFGKLTEVSVQVQVADPQQFLTALQGKLAEQGLFAKKELPSYLLCESIPEGTLSLGPLSMQGWVNRVRASVGGKEAVVVGPRSILSELGLTPQ